MAAQWWHFRRAMAATLSISGYRKRVWSEHAAILRAIAAGRPAQAQALSIAHTRAARAVLLGKLKQVLTERTVARRAGRARRERRQEGLDARGGRLSPIAIGARLDRDGRFRA